jgi:tetratricopeptide (TPR) repeat protein
MQGITHKGMGSCYFFQGAYEKAIDHYRAAYQILLGSENANWRAALCQDLAEAYAETGNWPAARRYFEEGRSIARQLGHDRYLRNGELLAERYPALVLDLNARQEQALAFVQENGRIAMRQYLALCDVSRSQAHRDLKALCRQGALQQVGRGRAAHYVMPQAG